MEHGLRAVDRPLATLALVAIAAFPASAFAQPGSIWVTSWATASQGPFPSGAASAMPDQGFAFPDPAVGANDQSFRLIVRPSVWAGRTRLRFSNAFGNKPVTFDGVFVGLQSSAAAVVPGTNAPVLFAGRKRITIAPGNDIWSDPVTLPFATTGMVAMLAGRKLAVSFHVAGSSGPMTWHAKGMQTSYASPPLAGSHGGEDGEQAFPMATTAWFFLDAIDMRMPRGTPLVVCFGDSITDGTASTLNGDDRWPDALQRRLAGRYPNGVAVVDEGIGSNQITGPESYDPKTPFGGGPAALQRIDRDVAALSGVKTVIWFEGINDLSHGQPADAVVAGFRTGIVQLRKAIPGVRIVGATITPALGSKGNSGTDDTNQRRKAVNGAIRAGGLFDGYVDFERAVKDPQSDTLKAEYVPNGTIGGPGDHLHPNRAGYLAMAGAIDPELVLPASR
ncbi:lysophospholipase [Nostoc sp. 3335mG]|nr:lysophospholipase [Nostoc sp. 3335mG]